MALDWLVWLTLFIIYFFLVFGMSYNFYSTCLHTESYLQKSLEEFLTFSLLIRTGSWFWPHVAPPGLLCIGSWFLGQLLLALYPQTPILRSTNNHKQTLIAISISQLSEWNWWLVTSYFVDLDPGHVPNQFDWLITSLMLGWLRSWTSPGKALLHLLNA